MTTRRDAADSSTAGASSPALWASAFVLMALIITQAGRLTPAAAGDVSEVGDMTILTANAGDQEEVLCILDGRGDTLFIYGVENRNTVQLYQQLGLNEMFINARANPGGR